MNQLDRLVELVNRTQLPTVVQSSDAQASCVVVPFALYERLSQGGFPHQSEPLNRLTPTSVEVSAARSELPAIVEDPKTPLSLQDLLHTAAPVPPPPVPTSPTPQIEALEDRFAFDGGEVRILPQLKQKSGLGNPASGPFGPTLA